MFPDYITQHDRLPKHDNPHHNAEHSFKVPFVNSLPTNAGDSGKFSIPNHVVVDKDYYCVNLLSN